MTTDVKLELRLDDETPCGRVIDAAGKTHEFTGWLGMTAAIEKAAAVDGDVQAQSTSGDRK
ncbi:MAG: hypothetical protein ACJ74P_10895 [Gaiellaceae bacterium]|jgi:hypothetical protein